MTRTSYSTHKDERTSVGCEYEGVTATSLTSAARVNQE